MDARELTEIADRLARLAENEALLNDHDRRNRFEPYQSQCLEALRAALSRCSTPRERMAVRVRAARAVLLTHHQLLSDSKARSLAVLDGLEQYSNGGPLTEEVLNEAYNIAGYEVECSPCYTPVEDSICAMALDAVCLERPEILEEYGYTYEENDQQLFLAKDPGEQCTGGGELFTSMQEALTKAFIDALGPHDAEEVRSA